MNAADVGPVIAVSLFRASQVYVFVPSLVRLPLRSYVSAWAPNVS